MHVPFLHACTFGFMEKRGFSALPQWRESLRQMAVETGCNAVALPVTALMEHTYSTRIDFTSPAVVSREDILAVVEEARALGLRVILKAMVNCRDGYWRAYIRFFDRDVPGEPTWGEWFASYEVFVFYLADIAREIDADLFCIGCETVGTDHRETEWRRLISGVRARFSGPITYNCDKYQEDLVRWWDAVDLISSSGYYPLDTLDENLQRIKRVAESFDRPFLFMEAGCPSRQGSEYLPNNWQHPGPTDAQAQQRWYDAMCQGILRYPFIRGVCWWDWPATRLYPKALGPEQNGYCVFGKPAAQTLKAFSGLVRTNENGGAS